MRLLSTGSDILQLASRAIQKLVAAITGRLDTSENS